MLKAILLAAIVFGLNIGLLSLSMAWFARFLRDNQQRLQGRPPKTSHVVGVLYCVMLALLAASLIQSGVWAIIFWLYGGFADYESAFYFSVVNFATLGYGDMTLQGDLRLLGPLEAINGSLMLGLFASILYAVFARLSDSQRQTNS
ncbi:potassium channel family protein [Chitinilyticum litopenaei]|uniref:potassium channel family protein n=1 Tax=Chitinilyticum litopenaei TaxID=1121276 RepID=UPI00040BB199|nr:potassium channel family protein [Chitinilyticum litopenaei]